MLSGTMLSLLDHLHDTFRLVKVWIPTQSQLAQEEVSKTCRAFADLCLSQLALSKRPISGFETICKDCRNETAYSAPSVVSFLQSLQLVSEPLVGCLLKLSCSGPICRHVKRIQVLLFMPPDSLAESFLNLSCAHRLERLLFAGNYNRA